MGLNSYKINSNRLGISMLIIMIILSFNTVSADEYSTETLTANGGSTYELLLNVSSPTWAIGDTISVIESIKPLSFGSSISDFHDIVLSIRISDGADFSHTAESSGLGIANNIGDTYQVTWIITVDNSFPTSFSIYLGSEFREDKSAASDPSTDDGWNSLVDISVTGGTDSPAAGNPIQQHLTTTVEPVSTPTSTTFGGALFTILIFIIICVVVLFIVYIILKNPAILGEIIASEILDDNDN